VGSVIIYSLCHNLNDYFSALSCDIFSSFVLRDNTNVRSYKNTNNKTAFCMLLICHALARYNIDMLTVRLYGSADYSCQMKE
jgi:hypothetical protein